MISEEKAPVDTACLHRSTRSTRYVGFRVDQVTDTRKGQSKVKPREAPSIACSSKATAPCSKLILNPVADNSEELPPPTPIHQLQYVGNVMWGVPSDDLTAQKLLATDQGEEPEKH